MTVTHNTNEDIIGRSEINDIDAILAIENADPSEVEHVVKNNADTIFTWDYTLQRPALRKLYEKAKVGQWNATTDLDWTIDVDPEKIAIEERELIGVGLDTARLIGTPVEKWGDKEWLEFNMEGKNWSLSQFMHGEQGALHVHGQDRRDGAVVRRQALRQHAGRRRGPPCRGLRPLPRREARRQVPDQHRTCGCCSTTSSTTADGT